jgi:hypothetical protein
MSTDRHISREGALASALRAVRDELDEAVALAENGGPYDIQMISDMMLDYVAARSVEGDPTIESRDTWTALKTAAETAADYVAAQDTPLGEEARAWVEYLGVGFGFTIQREEKIDVSDWIRAYHLALICRDQRKQTALYELVRKLAPGPETIYARALASRTADVAGRIAADRGGHAQGSCSVNLDEAETPGGEVAMLDALVRGDGACFQQALATALERHREMAGDRVRDLVAWGPLALVALAHDCGLPVETESGYLPTRLVTGAGPKEVEADKPVPRPPYPEKTAAYWLDYQEKEARGSIEGLFAPDWATEFRSAVFRRFAEDRFQAFAARSFFDPAAENPRQWAELVLASQAYRIAYQLAAVPSESELAVTIGGRTGRIQAPGPTRESDCWHYTKAVAFALTARAAEDLALLAGLGEEVFQHGTNLPDTVHYAFALQAYLSGDAHGVRTQVKAALGNAGRDDHAECLRQPPVRLLDRLISDDPAGFNRALAEALDLYRQYYSVADRENDPEALISIDALGLACLAHDRGWTIEVESDYLSRRIVDGSWIGTPLDLTPFGPAD